ncbi:MAG: acyltransferase family protein, partial [Verrucomicrobiota bacterium]
MITSIILNEYDSGEFKFINFWKRRIRRILPVLSVMVLVVLISLYFIEYRPQLLALGSDALASVLSFANIAMWQRVGNYWGNAAESSPLLHAWSLSIEEQYYLLYPILIITLLKRKYSLLIVIGGMGLCSFLLFLLMAEKLPVEAFYLLPSRMWELCAGCLLAVFNHKGKLHFSQQLKGYLSFAGITMILASYLLINGESGISFWLIIPVIGTLLVILDDSQTSFISTVLSSKPLVFIGKLSYSLYLWHWPLIVVSERYFPDHDFSILLIMAGSFIASLASYYFIEKPIRKHRHGVLLALLLACLALSASLYFFLGKYQTEYPPAGFERVDYYGKIYDLSPRRPSLPRETRAQLFGTKIHTSPVASPDAYLKGGMPIEHNNSSPDVLLWGDSHGNMWAKLLTEVCNEQQLTLVTNTMDATSPFFHIPPRKSLRSTKRLSRQEKFLFEKAKLETLKKWRPQVLIIACRWSHNLVWKSELSQILKLCQEQGTQVLLIGQPPELPFGNNLAAQYLLYAGYEAKEALKQYMAFQAQDSYLKGYQLIEKHSMASEHVSLLDLRSHFVNTQNKAWIIDGREILYYDDDH